MSDTKILQGILDGQRALKEELSAKIDKVDKKVDSVKEEVLENRKRIDKIGYNLAVLSDDAPTIEEFDNLGKRVSKLENQVVN
ncbi:MAG: hypothetical protein UT39_C0030G0002 [Candidatus Woesebacteria bacterium GW2011_GWA1_39_21]|uniref:Uncharacterized protein n=1 Tax=Candidatus Woesebacteria bacterium GW2011_GWA1_39_21 TaxID=1618550 RepID=A0A0G0N0D9_9BACT|nr:MAG: hypothetical protein UT39_C0030G0002 [Candidatus Woesebacteria bacterium GW2011_GWA1_39_21]